MALAVPIGPVTIEMIKRGLCSGFIAAMNIRIGAILGHSVLLITSYLLLQSLHQYANAINVLALFGSLFLLYTGITTFYGKTSLDDVMLNKASNMNGLLFGVILAFVNPVSVVFWLSIFAASLQANGTGSIWYNFLILLGVLVWGICLSTILAISKSVLSQKFIKIAVICSSVLMAAYGAYYGYLAALGLMSAG